MNSRHLSASIGLVTLLCALGGCALPGAATSGAARHPLVAFVVDTPASRAVDRPTRFESPTSMATPAAPVRRLMGE